jgi:catechol 2,3-dioxygenase-like lactoylglutathione lyase family enzyme
MELEVIGIDHLYISVRDLQRSERFYDPVMEVLGFRKGTRAIAGEPHAHYFNRVLQYSLRPARSGDAADAYRVGALHHLCFQVRDARAVDEAYQRLRALGVDATEPKLYPDYRPDYYATFFADPDGTRLEVVSDSAGRRLIRERFDELDTQPDPVPRLLARDAQAPRAPNLFAAPIPSSGEAFAELAKFGATTIERIVSSAQPASEPYDQAHDEWVVLLRGAAELEIAGERKCLRPGDHVALPAHTPHRVLATSEGALWLAVHVRGPNEP